METAAAIEGLRIVGGDPALDFANTRVGPAGGPPDVEGLRGYPDLVRWAHRLGLLGDAEAERLRAAAAEEPVRAEAAFHRALGTRDQVHALFATLAAGRPVPVPALEALREAEAEALRHADLCDVDGVYAWRWRLGEDLDAVRRLVVHAATERLTQGPLDRIKGCPSCSFLFLDLSRNGSRRWCSMDDCGREEKIRNYLARRVARRAEGRSPGQAVPSRPTGTETAGS